jgi:RNA recognition motif-containing protein
MLNKLFIGNIPFQAQEGELRAWFHSHGVHPAGVAIVRHRLTGNSRGFGFADFNGAEEAQSAVNELNGEEFQGRPLLLSIARSDGPAVQSPQDQTGTRA